MPTRSRRTSKKDAVAKRRQIKAVKKKSVVARKPAAKAKLIVKSKKPVGKRTAPRRTSKRAKVERNEVMNSIAELLEAAAAVNIAPEGQTLIVERLITPVTERDVRHVGTLFSDHLGIDVGYAWYGSTGRPLVLFPTSGGNHIENEDRGLIAALMPKITAGELQAICVESINRESWQRKDLDAAERVRRHDLYDKFLAEEFLPFVRAMAPEGKLGVYGASMGGYHAVNVAARHPDIVNQCIAFSGLFDVHKLLNNDPFWNEQCYFHSPVAFIPNMDAEWCEKLSQVEWVIATGEQDSLVEESRRLQSILAEKGIPCHGEIWPGVFGHDWPFWQQHLPRFA